jgi:hypothetical protein
MVLYNCLRCGYNTNKKTDMGRHCNRKKTCNPILSNIPINDCIGLAKQTNNFKTNKKHTCSCGKIFDRQSRLDLHQSKCKKIETKLEMLIENKKKEIEILRHQNQIELEKLKHQNEKELIKLIKPVPFHKETKQNFIYLLQEREFIKTGECVYKIGKTINPKARLTDYSKGTMVCCLLLCENCDELEKRLIAIFTEKFKLRCDIGKEYFEGDVYEMVNTIKLN